MPPELADDALDAVHALVASGINEGEILAAMHSAIYRGGGDDPGNEFIIGSGPDALLCRYKSGRRPLDAEDQLTLEWAGVYRHYHVAMMRTIPVGRAQPEHLAMHAACAEALEACHAAFVPGNLVGDVFDAYVQVMDDHGYQHARLNACGYSMGTTFAPNWMDWPMFYHGNPVVLEEGMVFFMHMILMDSETGIAMNLGESFVLENGAGSLGSAAHRANCLSGRDSGVKTPATVIGGQAVCSIAFLFCRLSGGVLPPDDHLIGAEGEVGDVFRPIPGDDQNVMLAIAAGPRLAIGDHDHRLHRDNHARLENGGDVLAQFN